MTELERNSYDGFDFVKTYNPASPPSWEVYWDGWISVGTYGVDESWEEIKSQWPKTKKQIIEDKLAQ